MKDKFKEIPNKGIEKDWPKLFLFSTIGALVILVVIDLFVLNDIDFSLYLDLMFILILGLICLAVYYLKPKWFKR